MADADDGTWLRGEEIAETGLIRNIESKGHAIERVNQKHFLWNEWQQCKTNAAKDPDAHPPKIYLREDARKIEVLEEFLHDTQERVGIVLAYPREEIHVKDFMVRHRRMLQISDADAEVLRQMLLRQVRCSRVDTDNHPLTAPASARTRIGI